MHNIHGVTVVRGKSADELRLNAPLDCKCSNIYLYFSSRNLNHQHGQYCLLNLVFYMRFYGVRTGGVAAFDRKRSNLSM